MGFELYGIYPREALPPHADDLFTVGPRAVFIARRDHVDFDARDRCLWSRYTPRFLAIVEQRLQIDLFFERDGRCQYLGEARVSSYGFSGVHSASFGLDIPLPRALWLELNEPLPARDLPCPEEAIAALTADSASQERVDALAQFVERWFGSRSAEILLPAMPTSLAVLHRLAAANGRLVVQNALVPPTTLTEVDGRVVFYVENQHVYEWAFNANGDDPAVWYRENDHRAKWQRENEPLSGFLIQVALFETIFSSPFGASAAWISGDETDRIRSRFARLPLAAWLWGGTTFYARNGALMHLMENGEGGFSVMVAALHPDSLLFIEDLVDDRWETVRF